MQRSKQVGLSDGPKSTGDELSTQKDLFPDLFDEKDADANLINLGELNQRDEGIYERDGFLLFAHSFLRRHHASLNALNLGLLQALSKARISGLATRLALDPDMVGLASSFAIFRNVAPVTETTFQSIPSMGTVVRS